MATPGRRRGLRPEVFAFRPLRSDFRNKNLPRADVKSRGNSVLFQIPNAVDSKTCPLDMARHGVHNSLALLQRARMGDALSSWRAVAPLRGDGRHDYDRGLPGPLRSH